MLLGSNNSMTKFEAKRGIDDAYQLRNNSILIFPIYGVYSMCTAL